MKFKQIIQIGDPQDGCLMGLDEDGELWSYEGRRYRTGEIFRGRKVISDFYTPPFWQRFSMSTLDPSEHDRSWNPSWIKDRTEECVLKAQTSVYTVYYPAVWNILLRVSDWIIKMADRHKHVSKGISVSM